jgi:hypothetical protein
VVYGRNLFGKDDRITVGSMQQPSAEIDLASVGCAEANRNKRLEPVRLLICGNPHTGVGVTKSVAQTAQNPTFSACWTT